MNAQTVDLYHAALKADDAFDAAVAKQFPRRRTGDMRYQTALFNAETLAAREAKIAADKAWHEAVRAQRAAASTDVPAIDLLRGLSLQTDDLHVHAFLQNAASHLEGWTNDLH